MSIRKVTDLPSLDGEELSAGGFLSSYLEISYPETLDGELTGAKRYLSRKMKLDNFVDRLKDAAGINEGNPFRRNLSALGGLTVLGSVKTLTSGHPIELNSITFLARAETRAILAGVPAIVSSHGGTITVDGSGTRIEGPARIRQVDQSDGESVVNMNTLSAYVAQAIQAALSSIDVSAGSVPIMSFVYADYEVTQKGWVQAGTTLEVSKYPEFSAWWAQHKSSVKTSPDGEGDEWYYWEQGGFVRLPKTKWFVQGYDQSETGIHAGSFISAGIPNHYHNVTYQNANCQCAKNGGIRSSHKSTTKKTTTTSGVVRTATAEDYAGSSLYGGSTTVQPNANKLYMYFYVGRKTA